MPCIRCGKSAPEGKSFCAECEKVIAVPLVPSPYLNTRILLPPQQTVKAAEQKQMHRRREENQRKPTHTGGRKGLVAAVVLLSLLCMLLLAVCGIGLRQYEQWQQDKSRFKAQEEQWQLLSAQKAELTDALAQEKTERANLSDLLEAKDAELSRLGQELIDYRRQEESADTDTAEQTLRDELQQYRQKLWETQVQVQRLMQDENTLTQEKQALQEQLLVLQEKMKFFDTHVVFVEDDGTNYYHHYDCNRFVKNSFWIFNLSAAESADYTPCPYCH